MKEYIERKALLENIKKYQNDVFGIPMIIAEIENMPAVDVEKVVHAKWLDTYPYLEPNPMFMYGICSNCGAETSCKTKFCSECGAVMDLELRLTEYEKKCLWCKYNYKTLEDVPRCNELCENHSEYIVIDSIKEKF